MHITYELECLPEDMPVRGNAMASGDDAYDKAVEDEILADLESGNEWAWCVVKVTATGVFNGVKFHGVAYLGGVSCKSREDFETGDADYLEAMKADALADLCESLKDTIARAEFAKALLAEIGE